MDSPSSTADGCADGTRARAGAATPSKRQIRSHTGLRGIAALLVVAYHQQLGPFYKLPIELSTNIFRRSYLMVDLFFILSGFIISYVYRADRDAAISIADTKAFLFTRFARIYPLHLGSVIYLLVFTAGSTALLAAAGHANTPLTAKDLNNWLLQLALLNAWIPGYDAWNTPSWSISAEMFAYLLFPVIVALHVRTRRLTRTALLSVSFGFFIYVEGTTGSLDIIAGLAPLRCLAGFSLGMLLYFYRSRALVASDALLSASQLVAVVWLMIGLIYKISDPLIIPAFALIVFATWPDRGVIARLLSRRSFQWLGDISYSVYLLHVPIGATLWFFWSHLVLRLGLAPAIARVMWLAFAFATVLFISTLSYRHIEVKARRGLLKWWGSRKPPSLEPTIAAP